MIRFRIVCCGTMLLLLAGRSGRGAEPRTCDARYKLELVGKEPDIVTPIGMAFDRKGRLLVVESHTHQPPPNYQGPKGDRIRMLSDSHGDGRLDRWTTFAEGFHYAMNVFVRDDGVLLVTRNNVVLLRDTDNDGVADKQEELLRLDTKGDYPHNGLSGIGLQTGGKQLLLGLGENVGMPYRLIGADGSECSGKDGAGCIFQCTPDGREVRRVAVGFWNPFGICALPDGRMFAVDNDPDASPPCRLVHVVWGGDYGFRYQYGRAGTHPLQAWNGELPGTLPYVIGVGEAPTALVAHAGKLWATSWGDHRIDRYDLVPRGASYGAIRETVVQGGVDFRPTGMAVAPDGSLYFADWVLSDYPVHGHGKVWRLTMPDSEKKVAFAPRSQDDLAANDSRCNPIEKIKSDDPFTHAQGVWELSQKPQPTTGDALSDRARLGMLEAARLRGAQQPESILRPALADNSADVQIFAVRWIGDERIETMREAVGKLLDKPLPSAHYYLTVLGAIDWLSHEPKMTGVEINEELLVRELKDGRRAPEAHALALSLLKPSNKFLTIEQLRSYLQSKQLVLQMEAVRSLAEQSNPERFALLAEVAQNEALPVEVRAEAVVGLSAAPEKAGGVFEKLAAGREPTLRREASRVLRSMAGSGSVAEAKPASSDVAAWNKLLAASGDPAAGRRLFFSPLAARCSVCHKYDGHGGNIGPDLTQVGRNTSREKLIMSILQPSQEIAPDYLPWTVVTADGKTYTGMRLPRDVDDGREDYADSTGKVFSLPSGEIEERRAASKSIMPDNLQSLLSIDDLRDLVTFLAAGKNNGGEGAH